MKGCQDEPKFQFQSSGALTLTAGDWDARGRSRLLRQQQGSIPE